MEKLVPFMAIAYVIGAVSAVIYVGLFLWYGKKRKSKVLHTL